MRGIDWTYVNKAMLAGVTMPNAKGSIKTNQRTYTFEIVCDFPGCFRTMVGIGGYAPRVISTAAKSIEQGQEICAIWLRNNLQPEEELL